MFHVYITGPYQCQYLPPSNSPCLNCWPVSPPVGPQSINWPLLRVFRMSVILLASSPSNSPKHLSRRAGQVGVNGLRAEAGVSLGNHLASLQSSDKIRRNSETEVCVSCKNENLRLLIVIDCDDDSYIRVRVCRNI